MMWHSLLFGCVLALGWQGEAPPSAPDLKADPRLQKPVSFHAKRITVRDFVKSLAEQTQVPLGVDKAYEQEKLTLFVKEKPAWEVMTHAVAVLGLEWRAAQNEGYFIARSKQRTEEELAEQKRRQQLREALEKRLRALQRTATQYRFDQLFVEYQRLQQARQEIEARKPEGWQDRLTEIANTLASLSAGSDLQSYLVGWLTAQWTPQQWQRFWQGTPFVACYPARPGLAVLPPEIGSWYLREQSEKVKMLPPEAMAPPVPEPPTSFYFVMRYDPHQPIIHYHLIASTETLGYTADGGVIQEWIPNEAENAPNPLLAPNLPTIPIASKPGEPNCCPQPVACTLADELEWLAERCEVAIIAQAFRVRLAWGTKSISQAQTLDRWVAENPSLRNYRFEYRDGYLLVRYPLAPMLRRTEIPESVIVPLEERARLEGGLTLDDYAQLALQLTPEQEQRLVDATLLPTFGDISHALCFDTDPLKQSLPAFRFWASLTPQQRKSALEEAVPLFYHQLSTVQKRLFWDAIESSLWDWRWISAGMLHQIDLLYAPEAEEELAFFLDRWDQEMEIIEIESPDEYGEDRVPAPKKVQNQREYVFHFGLSKEASVRYPVTLPILQKRSEEAKTNEGK